MAAGMLGVILALGSSQIPTFAANTDSESVEQAKQEIISQVGNEEMKQLGLSIEGGASWKVTDGSAPEGRGKTYYVDASSGEDTNEGTSSEKAWKSLSKVNEVTFQPGDRILLKAGAVWEDETLSPKGSGTKDDYIILSSYGEGDAPKIKANGNKGEALLLYNQEYWDISNLDISNTVEGLVGLDSIQMKDENGRQLSDLRGVCIAGKDAGELHGYKLHNLYVHDVTGEDLWISGSGEVAPGIQKGNGWDKSKRTGGIVFEIYQPASTEPTTFHDVMIEENVINNNSFGGIIFKQWKGDKVGTNELWASRDDGASAPLYESATWAPHTNIIIQDNYLSQQASDYACNTIYLTSSKDSMIQRNVSREAGTCGIEMYYTDNIVVQYNEVYDTRVKAGGADSNAIDPDKQATNTLIQYNYIHDTGDGILLCGFNFGSAVVRYNIIQDAEKRYLNPHGDKGINYVYNNIFYNSRKASHVPFVESSGGSSYLNKTKNMHYLYNNVFYNANSEVQTVGIGEGSGTVYGNNCYYGTAVTAPSQDENPVNANPQFVGDLMEAKKDISKLSNVQILATSPLIEAGKTIEQDTNTTVNMVQGTDLFGNAIAENRDIGVMEFQVTENRGIVSGYVTDPYGYSMEGAMVKLGDTTVQTDESGYYSFGEVAVGEYEISASMEQYDDSTTEKIVIESGKTVQKNLVLGKSHSNVGTITGTVTNAGAGLGGVVVTASLGENVYQGTTNESGVYTLTDIPVGEGYTLAVAKEGYLSSMKENIAVRPAGVVTVDFAVSKDVSNTEYIINEEFDELETGTFSGNEMWTAIGDQTKGTIDIIEEESGNKYLHINKTGNGEFAFYNNVPVNLSGIVTIEMRVKRTNDEGTANQFGMYSFNENDWTNDDTPSKNKNPMATIALSKGNILTHNKKGSSNTATVQAYNKNQWYVIRNVVNLDNGTFDFYVDDMNNAKLSNQTLRTAKDKLDRFLVFASSSNLGDICVDYFRVCIGTPYDYEDAELIGVQANGSNLASTDGSVWEGNVSAETEFVNILPKTSSKFASVMVNGTVFDGENPVQVMLQGDETTFPIVVTAESGKTKEFTIKICRENADILAYLTSLEIPGVELTPVFDSNVMEYTASVGADVVTIQINATPVGEAVVSEITVNGTTQGTDSEVVLQNGENVIGVTVGSADGTNYNTYTIQITKEAPFIPDVNDSVLVSKIEEARTEASKSDIYTKESIEVLNKTIAEAEEVLNKEGVTQIELDEQVKKLQAAIDGLEKKTNEKNPQNPSDKEQNDEQQNDEQKQNGAVKTGDVVNVFIPIVVLMLSLLTIFFAKRLEKGRR